MKEAFDHIAGAGESIPSIAKDCGFFWKTIWNHGSNSELKSKREDPNVLFEGDVVHVPALEEKWESRPSEARHEFRRKGDPLKFRMQLRRFGEPRANEEYVLDIDGKLLKGKTGSDGKIEQWIPGNAKSATLLLDGGKEQYDIAISRLDPVDTISGARQRLANLGFAVDAGGGDEVDAEVQQALRDFQSRFGLSSSGALNGATKGKLKELHP